ncbi:hypothetical protein [Streptomyces pseudoechinosporeus]
MNEITGIVADGLENKGWVIRVVEVAPRMARLLATDSATGAACELDILKEIFHRPPTLTDAGPTLSRDDAVGLKVRALHDRGFPRRGNHGGGRRCGRARAEVRSSGHLGRHRGTRRGRPERVVPAVGADLTGRLVRRAASGSTGECLSVGVDRRWQ